MALADSESDSEAATDFKFARPTGSRSRGQGTLSETHRTGTGPLARPRLRRGWPWTCQRPSVLPA